MSKLVFICSPYGGKAENIELARRFMRMAAGLKHTPVAPHVMLHGVMDDHKPEHRAAGLELSTECLLPMCWELWLCGDEVTPGMAMEKAEAEEAGIRVREVPLAHLAIWEALQTHSNRFMMYHDWQWGDDPDKMAARYHYSSKYALREVLQGMKLVGEISFFRDRDL